MAVGLGALAKFTVLTFLAGPSVYVFASLLRDVIYGRVERPETLRRLLRLGAASAIAVALAALWYWPNREDFIGALRFVTSLDSTGQPLLSPFHLLYYVKSMPLHQMGVPLFAVFLFALFRLNRCLTKDHSAFLLVWLASIFVIYTANGAKGNSRDIGILLPVAVISAVGIVEVHRRRIVAVAFTCFVALHVAMLSLPGRWFASGIGTFSLGEGSVELAPRAEDWRVEDVMIDVADHPVRIAVVADHIFINATTFDFYRLKDKLPAQLTPCWRLNGEGNDPAALRGFDLVIAKSDNSWIKPKPDGCFREADGPGTYAEIVEELRGGSSGFSLIRTVPLPDASSLLVFQASARRP